MPDNETIREQKLYEDQLWETADFIQQLERLLHRFKSEIESLDKRGNEYEFFKYEISKITKELDRAYIEQNKVEEKLVKLGVQIPSLNPPEFLDEAE